VARRAEGGENHLGSYRKNQGESEFYKGGEKSSHDRVDGSGKGFRVTQTGLGKKGKDEQGEGFSEVERGGEGYWKKGDGGERLGNAAPAKIFPELGGT